MAGFVPYSGVAPHLWPPSFQRLLHVRRRPSKRLARRNVAMGWQDSTFEMYVESVGYFVAWLRWTGRVAHDAEYGSCVNVEILRAYTDDLERYGCSFPTIASRINGIRAALAALEPQQPTHWLMAEINRLRTEPSDRRRTGQRMRHTLEYVDLGMSLMNAAVDPCSENSEYEKAVKFRDGLIITFLALATPRRHPLAVMTIDVELVRLGDVYKVRWAANQMKENRAHEAMLGPALSDLFTRYTTDFRPTLLARERNAAWSPGKALWINSQGRRFRAKSIYRMFVSRTQAAFGESVYPHAVRHSAATSLALERPDLIELITPLLQHRSRSSDTAYKLASSYDASTRFGENLNTMRFTAKTRNELRRLMAEESGDSGNRETVTIADDY